MKVILLMAITLDGKIAKHTTQLADWTSKADKKIFVAETKKAGVIIMGKTTYETIGKPLPGRLNIVLTSQPKVKQNIPQQLEFTNSPPIKLIKRLENKGYTEVILGGGSTTNGLFLKENLIDEIWLTLEPKIFGDGLLLFKGIAVDLNLELIEVKSLTDNILHIRYKIIK
jgi:dihydrofolate reductase